MGSLGKQSSHGQLPGWPGECRKAYSTARPVRKPSGLGVLGNGARCLFGEALWHVAVEMPDGS